MAKRIMAVCLVLALLLTGCLSGSRRNAREQVLYNDYMGIVARIPASWEVTRLVELNLSPVEGVIDSFEQLDKQPYAAFAGMIYFLSMQSEERTVERNTDSVSVDLYGEYIMSRESTLAGYVDMCIGRDMGGDAGVVQEQVTVGGTTFTRVTVESSGVGLGFFPQQEYYFCQVEEVFLTVLITYYPSSMKSATTAQNVMKDLITITKAKMPVENVQMVLTNGYLGLQVGIPDDYGYIIDINENNLTEESWQSDSLDKLEISPPFFIDMLNLYTKDEYDIHIALYADGDPNYTSVGEYAQGMVDSLTDIFNSDEVEILFQGVEEMGGLDYHLVVLGIHYSPGDIFTIQKYYIRQVRDMYFLAGINYDDVRPGQEERAMEILAGLYTFGQGTAEDSGQGSEELFQI